MFEFVEVIVDNANVDFTEVVFGSTNVVLTAQFSKDSCVEASAVTVGGSLFVDCGFKSHVNFQQLKVKEVASFSGSSFAIVPDFRYAKFDRPPEVANLGMSPPRLIGDPVKEAERLESGKEHWKKRRIKPSKPCPPFKVALDREDVARYRQLKVMAQAAGDHEKDGEFFAYEMMAKRGVETTTIAGLLFNTLYWRLSDYGQSFTKPLKWMGGFGLVFMVFFRAVIDAFYPVAPVAERAESVAFSAVLSAQNIFPVLKGVFRFTA